MLADNLQRRDFALAVNYCLTPGRKFGEGVAERVAAFLRAAGAFAKLKSPRGRALMAACGQLGRVN